MLPPRLYIDGFQCMLSSLSTKVIKRLIAPNKSTHLMRCAVPSKYCYNVLPTAKVFTFTESIAHDSCQY